MISGIGTDIVVIERFQRFIDEDNTALLERLFTEQERERLCSQKRLRSQLCRPLRRQGGVSEGARHRVA